MGHVMDWFIVGVRLVVLFFVAMCLVVIHMVWKPFLRVPPSRVARFFYKIFLAVMGIEVHVQGERYGKGCLFVANHVSWLDIPILGVLLSDVRFIAKETLLFSRIFSIFSWWHPPLFVRRHRRFDVRQQRDMLLSHLKEGRSLVLFAEGYAGDGNKVRDFKSSLFDAAYAHDIPVQPISVAYGHMEGIPVRQMMRPCYAWYGRMDWKAHVRGLLPIYQSLVTMRFYQPIVARTTSSRKELAHMCCVCVRRGVAHDLYGAYKER